MPYTVEDAHDDYLSRRGKFPVSYHHAMQHLIIHGPHSDTSRGRTLCATALRDLRRTFGRQFAMLSRSRMQYICGMLPQKGA